MKILKNTLNRRYATHSDPGQYPSGAGGWPQPSREYLEKVEGELHLAHFTAQDLVRAFQLGDDWMRQVLEEELVGLEVKEFYLRIVHPDDETAGERLEDGGDGRLVVTVMEARERG